jgi:hypothetical protein
MSQIQGNELKQLAILIAVIAIMMIAVPNVLTLGHIMHKWAPIPICRGINATHHETEGNVSRHINNCA